MNRPENRSGAQLASATIPALFDTKRRAHADDTAFRQWRDDGWQSHSWTQYAEVVCRLAGALCRDGLQRGDRVSIMGDVSQEWLLADMATMCAGAITVGIYFTSSAEEVEYYLADSGTTFAFVGAKPQLDTLLRTQGARGLKKIVVLDPAWTPDGAQPANVVSLSEFTGSGSEYTLSLLDRSAAETRSQDIASIGYTSGTTGRPKGAVLTHLSMLAGANTTATFAPGLYDEPHRVAVHLPLSHTVARAQGATLPLLTQIVPHFGDNTSNFAQTIRRTKPTYYMAPPRFYQRFAAEILNRIQCGPARERKSYRFAMSIAKKVLAARHAGHTPDPLMLDLYEVCRRRIFVPLLSEVGFDQLEYPITASAPMPSEVMTLWQLWGLNLKECYGQTEMVGGNVGQIADWSKAGTIGLPIPDPAWETKVLPDGEMIVKGPGLFVGYWNKPEETASALREGWLYTGDIVEVQKDGALKLVDRKKEIINTAGGKSISPTQVENELRKSPYISEAAVVGEGKKYLTALIEIDAAVGMSWAKAQDATIRDYADLARSEVVARLIEEEVAKANNSLARAEQIKAFRILPEELSPDNGVMTPTRKKKRKEIMVRYLDLVSSMYDSSEERLISKAIT